MDIRQLRYFIQVAERGSFSRAADHLRVAQPALSKHIQEMESELGVRLLDRSARGVSTTEAGERLLAHAHRILAEFAEIPDSVRGEATPRGEVRLGLPGTVSELVATPLIEAARARYPQLRIRIVEAMSGYIREWLMRGEIDLAIVYSAGDPRGLAVRHVLSEEICLFAAPKALAGPPPHGREIALGPAAALPLILPGPRHGLRELLDDRAGAAGVALDPAIEIDSYSQIKSLAQRGLGFGVLPRMAVEHERRARAFRLWRFDPQITRDVYLAYSTDRSLRNASRAVAGLAWDILRGLVREGAWAAELSPEARRAAPLSFL